MKRNIRRRTELCIPKCLKDFIQSVMTSSAIRTLYQQKIDGWNAKSGEAFSAPNTEDSDHIGFGCTYLKGPLEIASFHQILFDRFIQGRD